uniref:Uncharacterized protein n=1 Tax=Arundo donax TaxID=35708 RepID=A0A0A9DI98_ARUDO
MVICVCMRYISNCILFLPSTMTCSSPACSMKKIGHCHCRQLLWLFASSLPSSCFTAIFPRICPCNF